MNEVKWISVDDQLPEPHQSVLAWLVGGALHEGVDWMAQVTYIPARGGFALFVGDEDALVYVSHWTPLPDPPAPQRGSGPRKRP